MNIKTIINILSKVFDWLWNINLILGLMAIVLITINSFSDKTITANYLGNFKVKIEQVGVLHSLDSNTEVYVNDFIGTPSILLNSKTNLILIYTYVSFILSIVLFFNYHLMKLFKSLQVNITNGTPFGSGISKRFTILSKGSIALFAFGLLLSIAKITLIDEITCNGLTYTPIFDSQILNLAWLAIGFLIVASIFKVGLELKQEKDLTI